MTTATTTRVFALLSTQGTAMHETAVCSAHMLRASELPVPDDAASPRIRKAIYDNTRIACNFCGERAPSSASVR